MSKKVWDPLEGEDRTPMFSTREKAIAGIAVGLIGLAALLHFFGVL